VARRRKPEEHQSHDAWAIPFGDLLTLLLAFFVVMYAISSVNNGKYRVLSHALTAAFRGMPLAPQPIAIGDEPSSITEQMPISTVNRMFTAGLPDHERMPLPQARGTLRDGQHVAGSSDPRLDPGNELVEAEAARQRELNGIETDVSGVLGSLIRSNTVHVQKKGDAVEVQISADILFASGAAEPAPAAVPVLQRLAEALRPWPNAVRVEGHTDDVPIKTGSFHSNWELSGARAGSVVRLFADHGVDPQRLAVVGYGQFRPLQSNMSATGRNANRRVVVVILGSNHTGEAPRPRRGWHDFCSISSDCARGARPGRFSGAPPGSVVTGISRKANHARTANTVVTGTGVTGLADHCHQRGVHRPRLRNAAAGPFAVQDPRLAHARPLAHRRATRPVAP